VAKILDMGLSKQLGGEEQTFHTGTGVALGTPHYLSPEQAEGKQQVFSRLDSLLHNAARGSTRP
jgi:serine/threonine protein kinase